MARIDVSELTHDPDFADKFVVVRRDQSTAADGRSQITPTTFNRVIGVVTAQGPADLIVLEDGQRMPRVVSVVTKFRLRGPADNVLPDQVIIDGVTFTITQILPFTRFGAGFVEAIATSMNAQNAPPT